VTAAGTVNLQRVSLEIAAADVPQAEALLTLAGAETITLRDAADTPVFEPEPGTAPLWPRVTLHALFAVDANLAPLRELLAAVLPGAAVTVEALAESAWQPGLQQAVKARPIGARLWLAPADDPRAPEDRITVRINMGLAFGTGEHPTTALCLDWLERHVTPGSTLLDYGCGSGILALTALALGATKAFAVDNDDQALTATRANAQLNGLATRLHVAAPDALPAVSVDVLAANILAGPLVELAPRFAALVRPGGWLVLSGILEPQAARVATAYTPYFGGLEQAARDGWVRLAARRDAVNRVETR
jgi:ribosomal protein L11 methyltransferase